MPKGHKFSDMVRYFEKLASLHKGIQHSKTQKHFFRLEMDELSTGLKNAYYPVLALEGYTYTLEDQRSDNIIKHRAGAFNLLFKLKDSGDYDAMHNAWDLLETIGDDIIARIKEDKRNPNAPVYNVDLNSIEATLLTVDSISTIGIRYTYTIDNTFPSYVDETKWLPEA